MFRRPFNLVMICFFVFIFSSSLSAAVDEGQFEDHDRRIRVLEEENGNLRSERMERARGDYEVRVNNLHNALSKASNLETKYEALVKEKELSSLLINLTEASNPTSTTLGFEFSDVILEAAEMNFFQNASKEVQEDTKGRFFNILSNIIQNPVVSSLVDSNPLTSVISSVIQSVAGFSQTIVTGGGLRSISATTETLVSNEEISNYKESLLQYVGVYDSLLHANNIFSSQLALLEKKNQSITLDIADYEERLVSALNLVDEGEGIPYTAQLSRLLELRDRSSIDSYTEITNNQQISEAYEIALLYPSLEERVNNYRSEFSEVLVGYLVLFKEGLIQAQKLDKSHFNNEKLTELIEKIDSYISSRTPRPKGLYNSNKTFRFNAFSGF